MTPVETAYRWYAPDKPVVATLTFASRPSNSRTPAWASKSWWVSRGPHGQYPVGMIRWDDMAKHYRFWPGGVDTGFDESQLQEIAVFLKAQTATHRDELWKRNCKRTAKQATKPRPKKRRPRK